MLNYNDCVYSSIQHCEWPLRNECDSAVRGVRIPKGDCLLGHIGDVFINKSPFGVYVQAIQMAMIIFLNIENRD